MDDYRDKTPEERLQIAFFSIKEHLNINGPPAPIESIIEGREDDLLFLYLEKIKLFYCTSYGPTINPKTHYGSTKSLNRSHSLNAADNKRPTGREYRSQTSSPYPGPLYANNSCTNLESIMENSTNRMMHRNPRPHSYHELSTGHVMSSSGARVVAVETESASELEENDVDIESNNIIPTTSDLKNKNPSSIASSFRGPSDQVKSSDASDSTKSQDGTEARKISSGVTPTVIPKRHKLPPFPKSAPPPPPPVAANIRRQIAAQMESTDEGHSSLRTFLSLSKMNLKTAIPCEACIETQAKFENIIKKERELFLHPLQKAC